jgi:transcriptional regulator with XRE-family HTH domain
MGRHRTAEEKAAFREQAVAMRRDGLGAKRIARELGIGGDLVNELLRDEPVPSSLRRPRAKDELRDVAIALRRSGRTYDEIRDELGVSKGSLSLWLRAMAHPTDEQRLALNAAVAVDLMSSDVPSDAETARELRREGWLLREIADELGISPKTAFLWCRGIPTPARAVHGRSAEETRAMGRAYWDVELERRDVVRQAAIRSHQARVGLLSERELDLVVATAYWCEGSKSKPWARREKLQFINSDPDLVRLLIEWLRRRGAGLERCRLSVNIHESGDLAAATRFWANATGCDEEQLAKPLLKRHNPLTVRKNVGESYVGCLSIGVRQSRDLYREIEGLWRGIVAGTCALRDADAAD